MPVRMIRSQMSEERELVEARSRSSSGGGPGVVEAWRCRAADLFNFAREKLLGDDYWIPGDPTEVVGFPSALLPAHKQILVSTDEGDGELQSGFTVCQGTYKNRPSEPLYHVSFTWTDAAEKTDGKRLESPDRKPKTLSIYRSTDLHEATDLYESCLHCDELFFILDKRKDLKRDLKHLLSKLRSHPLWQAAHIAARMGTVAYFRRVKEEGGDMDRILNTACHPEGNFPLQVAIENNHLDVVKVLLELGANMGKTDVSGNNALHYGAKASSQMLELLMAHTGAADLLNVMNSDGCTPLFVAIRQGNPLCTLSLVRLGAELNITCKGRSPLHEAMLQTSGNTREVIKTLIEVSPGSLEDVEKQTGNYAAHMAASKISLSGLLIAAVDKFDVNARNNLGQSALHVHVHRADLGCVMTLGAYGADLNAQDANGNTALHIAVSKTLIEIVQALLVLGADANICNKLEDMPRHLAAKLHSKHRSEFVRCLSICGARRCSAGKRGCSAGCVDQRTRELIHSNSSAALSPQSSLKEGSPLDDLPLEQTDFQTVLDFKHEMCLKRVGAQLSLPVKERPKLIGLLSLDGGGIRGLVIIQILLAIEAALGEDLWDYFDWTAGTSTGSFVEAGLSVGKSLHECQRIYLRFKDQIFDGWVRPYNTIALENFIKKEMGEHLSLADVKYPRIVVTAVLADKHPVCLQLFRNYLLPLDEKHNQKLGFTDPKDHMMWKALRCSSAAPTYFASVDNKYVDGGVIANNPALDLLSEVQQWNSTLEYLNVDSSEHLSVACVLSIGTGRIPDMPIENLDFEVTGNPYKAAIAMQNLGFMLIDQVTATEGSPVDRTRAWCQSLGVPFFRFSTPMTKDIKLDTRSDSEIVSLMWDTQEYLYTQRNQIQEFCSFIKQLGTNHNRRHYYDVNIPVADFV